MRRAFMLPAIGAMVLGVASSAFAQTAPDPADPDLVFWLRADQGVNTTPDSLGPIVTSVFDSSDNLNDLGGAGTPRLLTRSFPTGPQSVISFGGIAPGPNPGDPPIFEGDAALYNFTAGSDALDLANLSIYMVAANDNGDPSQIYVANFAGPVAGFATGQSDGTQNRIKFFNAVSPVGPTDSLEPAPASVTPGVPFLLTATVTSAPSNNKSLYFNGALAGTSTGQMDYAGGLTEFTIGGLDPDGEAGAPGANYIQLLRGDIAEILIYSSVSESQRLSVEAYLNDKYFAGGGLEADFDGDGDVDGNDFLLLQRGLGPTYDASDFQNFRNEFGMGSAVAAAAAVPEPVSWALVGSAAFGAVGFARLRRGRR